MSGGFQGESSDTITPRLQRAELYVAQGRNEEALAEKFRHVDLRL